MTTTTTTIDDLRSGPPRPISAEAIVDAIATLYATSNHLREFLGDESRLGQYLEKAGERLIHATYEEPSDELFELFYAAGREKHTALNAWIDG